MIILVDDLRKFYNQREAVVFTATGPAILFLQKCAREGKTVEELYLDHDLGEENGIPITIMPLVDYLVETGLEKTNPVIENIIVHTSNPAGKNTMVQALSINRLNGTYKVTSGDAHDLGLGMPVFRPRRYRETDIGY